MSQSPCKLYATVRKLSAFEPIALFAHLSEYAEKEGQAFYQNNQTGISIGLIESALCLRGKRNTFRLRTLNKMGGTLFPQLIAQFPYPLVNTSQIGNQFEAELPLPPASASLSQRLKNHPIIELIRSHLLSVEGDLPEAFSGGLIGAFSYDLIRQLETIPENPQDELDEPNYLLFVPSLFFVIDKAANQTSFVALSLTKNDPDNARELDKLIQLAKQPIPLSLPNFKAESLISDTSQTDYEQGVLQFKEHIKAGDIFQGVYGRMEAGNCEGNPFAAFYHLTQINPSPFQFYLRTFDGALFGASPELQVQVDSHNSKQRVTISPIAGSRPVKADSHSNIRQQIRLRTDSKELAEHVMLIDLARNDIASIAKAGTTEVTDAFALKQYSHIQHLVSTVRGELQDRYDALDAYFATMNMGTLTGAPKVRATQLIARYEKNARGFFGGGFGIISSNGNMDTCIVIRSIRVKNDRVYLRAAAGIVADSHPIQEYEETETKMAACKKALLLASGASL
ncbi:MAG: anthranilate synthase component I family protein [Gammaproteobacteria bacterium]|nr:anthranilate synthase component I family protein [Gammaproteobacteria bacterium]